ncbi:MAG: PorV/PorQ family protein [Gemmatimonadota bacterium]|nr:PorV/PorQ family protein [Gemmatimonadota bacterium]MDQ8171985.1 PorV/PorQ family protein [Gemmatimonadota bacterium]
MNRFRAVWRWVPYAWCVCVLSLVSGQGAHAQNGALYLLVPFGAHAVGQGEAVAADSTLGTEALWWNPAALARIGKKELAVHHSQTLIATSDMLTFAVPSRVLGTIAGSAYLVNYGDQSATDPVNGTEIGTITNRNYQLALSYASPVGKRLSVGMTYKFIMLRFQCTGICGNVPVISGSTSALDLGAQYVLPTALPITLGASVRNVGPALQVKDAEQADPLPRVVQVGGRARLPISSLQRSGASLDVTLDIQQAAALNGAAGGLGLILGYRDVAFLRGGYKLQPGDSKGASIGLGFARGGFAVDMARRFDAASAQLGEPPTYVSLRARF